MCKSSSSSGGFNVCQRHSVSSPPTTTSRASIFHVRDMYSTALASRPWYDGFGQNIRSSWLTKLPSPAYTSSHPPSGSYVLRVSCDLCSVRVPSVAPISVQPIRSVASPSSILLRMEFMRGVVQKRLCMSRVAASRGQGFALSSTDLGTTCSRVMLPTPIGVYTGGKVRSSCLPYLCSGVCLGCCSGVWLGCCSCAVGYMQRSSIHIRYGFSRGAFVMYCA